MELALEQVPVKVDLKDLVLELREMEVLLSDLLWQVEADSQRDFNDWLNYMSNVPQSIQDGFGIDAKILMSLAVQYSTKESIERSKRNPNLGYKIELLQRETLRLFEEIKRFPLKLAILEERLDVLIELQGILIDLLKKYYLERPGKEVEDIIRYPLQRFETSQRYLMKPDTQTDKTKQEMALTYEHLEWQMNSNISDKRILEWIRNIKERTKAVSKRLP